MEETISQQLAVAGFSFLFGILMGMVCDAITILRCTVCLSSGLPEKHNRLFDKEWPLIGRAVRKTRRGKLEHFWFFWSDILFWTLLTVGSILFLFFFYDGRFRWFFAGSGVVGFLLYRLTVSRFVQLLFRYLLFFFQTLFALPIAFYQNSVYNDSSGSVERRKVVMATFASARLFDCQNALASSIDRPNGKTSARASA